MFSRSKNFCFENCILLAFGLGMCEGVDVDSRHRIGHVDIQVVSHPDPRSDPNGGSEPSPGRETIYWDSH